MSTGMSVNFHNRESDMKTAVHQIPDCVYINLGDYPHEFTLFLDDLGAIERLAQNLLDQCQALRQEQADFEAECSLQGDATIDPIVRLESLIEDSERTTHAIVNP